MVGKKRASPGAAEEKNLFDIEVSEEQEAKIKDISAQIARTELVLGSLFLPCPHSLV